MIFLLEIFSVSFYKKELKNSAILRCWKVACVKSGSYKAVPKRDRNCEAGDILDYFKFLTVVDGANAEICDSAALSALTSFTVIDKHYTYTLPQNDEEIEEVDTDDEQAGSGGVTDQHLGDTAENMPRFVNIS